MGNSNQPPKNTLSDYQIVLSAFLELRGRGVTVSHQDLEVLKSWAEEGLPPGLILQALEAIARETRENAKPFSNSLRALDRSVRRAIRESQNY